MLIHSKRMSVVCAKRWKQDNYTRRVVPRVKLLKRLLQGCHRMWNMAF